MASQRFPITVDLIREPRTLFRSCHGATTEALTDGLRSNYEASRTPHPDDVKATVLHMGVSMFEDGDKLVAFVERRPHRLGTHVVQVELMPDLGICIADTGGRGHWSVWGRPEVLVTLITDVVSVQA